MKTRISSLMLILGLGISSLCMGQNNNPNYNDSLATALGADDYGMKSYILVILKTGPNQNENKAFRDSCFSSHFENINHWVEEGKLIVAGPLYKNERDYRGIFIFDAETEEQAHEFLKGDASIQEGIFDVETYKWYGSAALKEYLHYSDQIWKLKP